MVSRHQKAELEIVEGHCINCAFSNPDGDCILPGDCMLANGYRYTGIDIGGRTYSEDEKIIPEELNRW